MIYECDDKYLAAGLLTFKGFKYLGCTKKDKVYLLINYTNKKQLINKLEQYLDNSFKVDFEKYKIKLSFIEDEILSC